MKLIAITALALGFGFFPSKGLAEGRYGRVRITLTVPEGAEVWFSGHRTTQVGTERIYHSPETELGRFQYTVRVSHTLSDGHVETEERNLWLSETEVRATFLRQYISSSVLQAADLADSRLELALEPARLARDAQWMAQEQADQRRRIQEFRANPRPGNTLSGYEVFNDYQRVLRRLYQSAATHGTNPANGGL